MACEHVIVLLHVIAKALRTLLRGVKKERSYYMMLFNIFFSMIKHRIVEVLEYICVSEPLLYHAFLAFLKC
jgi:hypothetical protein